MLYVQSKPLVHRNYTVTACIFHSGWLIMPIIWYNIIALVNVI
jgi:hypothetical protein